MGHPQDHLDTAHSKEEKTRARCYEGLRGGRGRFGAATPRIAGASIEVKAESRPQRPSRKNQPLLSTEPRLLDTGESNEATVVATGLRNGNGCRSTCARAGTHPSGNLWRLFSLEPDKHKFCGSGHASGERRVSAREDRRRDGV